MTKFYALLTTGAALIAAPALAQDAAPATPAEPTTQAAPAAPAATPATVTDAEVKTFAKAAIAVDKVNKDASLTGDDKNKKLAEAVTTAGIEPARFNEIATASGSDAALQKRIQDAIVAEQSATPAQ